MNRQTQRHATRRAQALERLGSITTGAAVAGALGTVGFGVAAAATFSGAASPADAATTGGSANVLPFDPDTVQRSVEEDDDDNAGSGSQLFGAAPAPRARTGGGHATTGGSG